MGEVAAENLTGNQYSQLRVRRKGCCYLASYSYCLCRREPVLTMEGGKRTSHGESVLSIACWGRGMLLLGFVFGSRTDDCVSEREGCLDLTSCSSRVLTTAWEDLNLFLFFFFFFLSTARIRINGRCDRWGW